MWSFITKTLTFYIPNIFIKGNKETKQAFREKYAICFLILFTSGMIVFLIELLPLMICNYPDQYAWKDIYNDHHNSLMVVSGSVYKVDAFLDKHPASSSFVIDNLGKDVSQYFGESCFGYCHKEPIDSTEYVDRIGDLVWSTEELNKKNMTWFRIEDRFYNSTSYIKYNETWLPEKEHNLIYNRMNEDATFLAKDLDTSLFDSLYIGKLDARFNLLCASTNISFLSFAGIVIVLSVIKFLFAITQLIPGKTKPICENIIINIPCYSEDRKAISKTINSILDAEYLNENKLMFIVSDGRIKGRGNTQTTPEILMNILGVEGDEWENEAIRYRAINQRSNNFAQVYSGFYNDIPFILVVKIGETEHETGNRGKRDSQLILLDFLNHCATNRYLSSELNSEIYEAFVNVGKNPSDYELLLTVDADTKLHKDSLNYMANKMTDNPKIIGLSGETQIENQSETWVTAIQVFEYFISQNMSKAFESIFNMVTCLPGCFSIYRIKDRSGPLLVCDEILEQYRITDLSSLHLKNLLALGEDRYMTTLLLKTFPEYSTNFIVDAICYTTVPSDFKTLLSQRRRWINSTIHNLVVLVQVDLCGFSIFSMRTVVFVDLISTLLMPVTVCYFYFLIIMISFQYIILPDTFLAMIIIIYSIQILIFLFRKKPIYLGWFIIYLSSHPIWNVVIPLYAFWHMGK